MLAKYIITDASNTLQSALTTTIPYETADEYPTDRTPASADWNNVEYEKYRNWIVDNAYDITLSYDGSADLTALIGDTDLSIRMQLTSLSQVGLRMYPTTISVVQPNPPTFESPLPPEFALIAG